MRRTTRFGKGEVQRRAALFASTALSAVFLASGAHAQLAANATPSGGNVVAGAASIAQAPGSTTVTQSSQRTAIDWQSFNVGSQAQVQFKQPDASAIALNRVTGGDLSQINGKITANGQIVLINQSGVVFAKGSQVNAESVVVSTADITNQNFMAGNMAFTGAPKPGAKIINNGNITAGQAGLVGLVAPQVANSGVITARLGQVTLAGATAFTLDLYGDRLISLDVTGAVRAVDVGGHAVPALVTNSGLILADGGHITLTAADADALVTQLIDAGGTIRADSVGAATGSVAVNGIGGNISISGNLLARGASGSGGTVQALTTGTVAVAQGALIDASGANTGGVIAIGTDLARANQGLADKTAPKAQAVSIAQGATLRADATAIGNGGHVTLLSANRTNFAGSISVKGGALGGDGGVAEVSGGVIDLGGTVLATAAAGRAGDILFDPKTLIVQLLGSNDTGSGGTFGNTGTTGANTTINTSQLDSLSGNVTLEAASLISVISAINMTKASNLSLISLGDITIAAGINVNGALEIDAGNLIDIPSEVVPFAISATDIGMKSGAGGIAIGEQISVSGLAALATTGMITETSIVTASGKITAGTFSTGGTTDGAIILNLGNSIASLAGVSATGAITLNNTGDLDITGSVKTAGLFNLHNAGNVTEAGGAISAATFASTGGTLGAATLTGANSFGTLGAISAAGDLTISGAALDAAAGTIAIAGSIATPATLGLEGTAIYIETTGGAISAATFTSGAGTLTGANLDGAHNTIGVLGDISVAGTLGEFSLNDQGNLVVAGTVAVPGTLTLNPTGTLTETGTIIAGTLASTLVARATLGSAGNTIATLGAFTTTGQATIDSSGTMTIAGPVSGVLISLGAAALDLTGNISATDMLTLDTTGAASQTGGAITAGTLAGSIGGALNLTSANNITASNGLTANSLNLVDDTLLTIAGTLSLAGEGVIADDAGITAATGHVLTIPTLSIASAAGDALFNTGNTVGTITGSLAAGTLSLADTNALTLGALSAVTANLTAPSITIADTVGIGSILALDATTGAIAETGTGNIQGGTLNSAGKVEAGNVNLSGTNAFAAIADFGAAGNITIADTAALPISGNLSVGTANKITLEDALAGITEVSGGEIKAGTLTTGAFSVGSLILTQGNSIATLGPITVTSAFDLNDTGGIAEAAGTVIRAGTFGGSFAGDVALLGTANTIGLLDALTITGAHALDVTDTGTLALGAVSVPNATISAGGIDITGAFTATTFANLISQADISESAGAITAGTLTGVLGGNLFLTAANSILQLGAITLNTPATHDFDLNDTANLTISNALNAANIALAAPDIIANASIAAGTGGILALAANSITTGAGTLLAPAGTIEIAPYTDGATIDLGGGIFSNAFLNGDLDPTAAELLIGTAAGHQSGNITIDGTANLDFTTPLLVLSTPGTITDNGTLGLASTAGTLEFDSAGFVQGATAALIVGTLAGDGSLIAGNVSLTSTRNSIGALGTIDTGTFALALTDAQSLDVTGSVAGHDITLVDLAAINIDGTVAAGANMFLIADTLTATGGTLAGPIVVLAPHDTLKNIDIDTTIGGNFLSLDSSLLTIVSPDSNLQIGGGAAINVGDITLVPHDVLLSGTAINFSGLLDLPGTLGLLNLASTGAVTESGTAGITAATLASFIFDTIGGAVALTGANHIATLANFAGSLGVALQDLADLAIAGTVSAGTLSLGGTNIAETTGLIIANTLTSGANSISGDASFANANRIGAVDGLTVGSTLILSNSTLAPLTLGNIAAASGAFTGSGIIIDGTVDIGTLTLSSFGYTVSPGSTIGISESTGGLIDAAILSGMDSAGDVVLGNANSIATLSSFHDSDNSKLNVTDAVNLTIAGTVLAPVIAFADAGTIDEAAGGLIDTGLLTGSGGDAFLTAANSIGTLSDFTTSGTLALTDAGLLTTAGAVSFATGTLSADGISFTGALTGTTLALASSAAVNEASTASIALATLTSFGSIGGALVLASSLNSIANLTDFNATGDITLTDAEGLAAGGVNAADVYLTAPGIAVSGIGVGSGTVGLFSTAGITEPAGAITAGLLTGTDRGGNVALGQGNSIGSLGAFTVTGDDFSLDNAGPLTVAGPLTANNATLSAAGISLTGLIDAAGLLDLASTGAVTQTGGSIAAGTVASLGAISGAVNLTLANSIATLAGFTLDHGFALALDDATLLSVAGPVSADTVALAAATIAIPGTITAGSLALSATTAGITETGGTIAAATLSATAAGSASLIGTNSIGTLAGVAITNGDFSLDDLVALAVDDTLTANHATVSATAIGIFGSIVADAVSLTATGSIAESGGIINAGTLAGTAGAGISLMSDNTVETVANLLGSLAVALRDASNLAITGTLGSKASVTLADAGNVSEASGGIIAAPTFVTDGTIANLTLTDANKIGTLGGATIGNMLDFYDDQALTVAGPVAAGNATLAASSITLAGDLNAVSLALQSPGGITQAAGIITAGTLTSGDAVDGAVSLNQANAIGSLGNFNGNAGFVLNDTQNLAIAGTLSLSGANTVSLTNSGGIDESAGNIQAAALTASIGGSLSLDNPNIIGTLGQVAAAGAFSLLDHAALIISGPVTAPEISLNAFDIAVAGAIDAADMLTLNSPGVVSETTGTITAGTLTGTVLGAVDLGTANRIAVLGNFNADDAAGTDFTLFDATKLAIAGTLRATGTVALAGTGDISETSGIISAPTLTTGGHALGGSFVLDNRNTIANIGNITAAGGLALNNSGYAFNGNVALGGTLALTGGGNISQTGGAITAATLTGNTGAGAVKLNRSGNAIPVLGNFTAPGGLSVTDGVPLSLAGKINAGRLGLFDAGNITQSAGIITTPLLNAMGADITLGDANVIAALGSITAGTLFVNGASALTGPLAATNATFTTAGNFNFAGGTSVTRDLDLLVAGNITQSANTGTIAAGTLTGTASNFASFGTADFGTIGSFLMQDSAFDLDNFGTLVLDGPLRASAVSLTVHGLLTLDGTPDGGLFITGKQEPKTVTVASAGDSVITLDPGLHGTAGGLVQTGTFFVNNKSDSATLFILDTTGSAIDFAQAPPSSVGLIGPDIDLVMDAGPTGTIAGNVNLYRLVILDAASTQLTGFLNDVGGQEAASNGLVVPNPKPPLRFNACPIGSVNCTILPIESLPSGNPLQNFDIEQRKKRQLNNNVQLPGIATRDF